MADPHREGSREYDGPDRREHHEPLPLPIWIKAIVALGVPAAIAIYLVWVGSNELPRLNNQVLLTHEEVVRLKEAARQELEQLQANFRMLQRLCSNTAKTDDDRQRCFDK